MIDQSRIFAALNPGYGCYASLQVKLAELAVLGAKPGTVPMTECITTVSVSISPSQNFTPLSIDLVVTPVAAAAKRGRTNTAL